MTNYTDIVHRALFAQPAPVSGAELFELVDSVTERSQISNALSQLVKTGRAEMVGTQKTTGKPVRLYRALVAPDHALDSASQADMRELAAEAERVEARARAAELDSRPGVPISASQPLRVGPPAITRVTNPAPTPRTHPALAEIQRELDGLRRHFESASSLQPSIQRGLELAAELKLGIPVFAAVAPKWCDAVKEAVDLLEELAA